MSCQSPEAANRAFKSAGILRQAVKKYLNSLSLKENDLILVASSGGADSLALAKATQLESKTIGKSLRSKGRTVQVGAVVIDHQLQENSEIVAEEAAEQLQQMGLNPVIVEKVDVNLANNLGLEAAARNARYEIFEEVASNLQAKAVLLGHTKNDQAEQVILGLARGSGAKSLAGMPKSRGIFHRPLLEDVKRRDCELACYHWDLEFWEDPTNTVLFPNEKYPLRTRVRSLLLPRMEDILGGHIEDNLARTAELLRIDDEALDFYAEKLLKNASMRSNDYAIVLDAPVLRAAPRGVILRTLKLAMKEVFDRNFPEVMVNSKHVFALEDLLQTGIGEVKLPNNFYVRINNDRMIFSKD